MLDVLASALLELNVFKRILNQVGRRAAQKAVSSHTRPGGFLDLDLGFALMAGRRVPISSKVLALAVGFGLTLALVALEAPLEALVGVIFPILGVAADLMVDGLEIVVFPFLIACLVLPRIAPRFAVEAVRVRRFR